MWDGDERRSHESRLERRIVALEKFASRHDTIAERILHIERNQEEIKELLLQMRGVANFLRVVLYVAAPLVGAVMWFREHVK